MKNQEIWKDIKKYEGYYQISNLGNVKRLPRYVNNRHGNKSVLKEIILKTKINKYGYCTINLSANSNKTFYIHRLIALSFIPNTENKPYINHKNGIKTDNRICNLEWVTSSENHLHAYRELGKIAYMCGKTGGKHPKSKRVSQISKRGKIIKEYGSMREAQRLTGINHRLISRVCLGGRKTSGGFIWKFSCNGKS